MTVCRVRIRHVGRLLDDLGAVCLFGYGMPPLLMGDTAQLPPVARSRVPLVCRCLERLRTEVVVDLTRGTPEQQSVFCGTLRACGQPIAEDACEALPKMGGFADIKVLPGDELIDALETCYDRDGLTRRL